uniref:G/T mismatch-specific thymine DNA glycosylase n=1 Tax=Knipowitschia caucasica TaxID=637954 RepID=A0AAV2L581_KNICA
MDRTLATNIREYRAQDTPAGITERRGRRNYGDQLKERKGQQCYVRRPQGELSAQRKWLCFVPSPRFCRICSENMYDRSSSQSPSDSGHVPSLPFSSNYCNEPNESGFYRESAEFYPNFQQNVSFQQQASPYPQQGLHQQLQQYSQLQNVDYNCYEPGFNHNYGAQQGAPFQSEGAQQGAPYQQFHLEPNEPQSYNEIKTEQEFYPPQRPEQIPQTPEKKKRGRPCKSAAQTPEQEAAKKRRQLNRFDGLSVEEVMSRTLPDVIEEQLDILIIGINPGLLSAYKGHHYPNPGNHFWKCLFLSGFTEKQLHYLDDTSLPQRYGIGFTNMVERTTPGSKDLSSKEIREGGKQLLEKLQKYKPLIAAFNGKGIYEIFCKETFGVKAKNLEFGLQPHKIPETDTVLFLMPSSSPRCAQFPRATDKVHFYIRLKELRDRLKGAPESRDVEETRYSFDLQLAKEDAKRLAIKEEQPDPEYESCAGVASHMSPEGETRELRD